MHENLRHSGEIINLYQRFSKCKCALESPGDLLQLSPLGQIPTASAPGALCQD